MYSYEPVLNGDFKSVDHVTIIDDFSDEIVPGLALLLAQSAKTVDVVTQWATVASSPYT